MKLEFTHDCQNCHALCCFVLMHRPSEKFPINEFKRANIPCHHLEVNDIENHYRCKIHSVLNDSNYLICSNYSCNGAGQFVTNLFKELGFSWLFDEPNYQDPDKQMKITQNLKVAFNTYEKIFKDLKMIKEHYPTGFQEVFESYCLTFFQDFNSQVVEDGPVDIYENLYKYKKIKRDMIQILKVYNFFLD